MSYLETIKVGDEIVIDTSSYGRHYCIKERVTKITPTQIVTNGGRYNKKHGHIVGASRSAWSQLAKIAPPDRAEELRQEIAYHQAALDIERRFTMTRAGIDQMRAAADAAEAALRAAGKWETES